LIQALAVDFYADTGHKVKISGGGSSLGADAAISESVDLASLVPLFVSIRFGWMGGGKG